jgi:hypothetical protein
MKSPPPILSRHAHRGQLYNPTADPGETINLYFKHPAIVKELKGLPATSKASGRNNSKIE